MEYKYNIYYVTLYFIYFFPFFPHLVLPSSLLVFLFFFFPHSFICASIPKDHLLPLCFSTTMSIGILNSLNEEWGLVNKGITIKYHCFQALSVDKHRRQTER